MLIIASEEVDDNIYFLHRLRIVFHHQISATDVQYALSCFQVMTGNPLLLTLTLLFLVHVWILVTREELKIIFIFKATNFLFILFFEIREHICIIRLLLIMCLICSLTFIWHTFRVVRR